jgi:hypothetical protein
LYHRAGGKQGVDKAVVPAPLKRPSQVVRLRGGAINGRGQRLRRQLRFGSN